MGQDGRLAVGAERGNRHACPGLWHIDEHGEREPARNSTPPSAPGANFPRSAPILALSRPCCPPSWPCSGPLARLVTFVHMNAKRTSRPETADIRQWARSRGIAVSDRGPIPEAVLSLYRATPSVVRAWARRNGLAVATRGPLPAGVLESYLARPELVRRWAATKGIPVSRRGRIPEKIVTRYLEPYRQLTRQAG